MNSERPDDARQSGVRSVQKTLRPGLRRIPAFVWVFLSASGFGLLLAAMGLKGAFPGMPDKVFWTICVLGVTLSSVAVLMWGGRRNSAGILSSYSTPEEGIRQMEIWKWRLRRKSVERAVKNGQEKRDRAGKEPPAS